MIQRHPNQATPALKAFCFQLLNLKPYLQVRVAVAFLLLRLHFAAAVSVVKAR